MPLFCLCGEPSLYEFVPDPESNSEASAHEQRGMGFASQIISPRRSLLSLCRSLCSRFPFDGFLVRVSLVGFSGSLMQASSSSGDGVPAERIVDSDVVELPLEAEKLC